MAAYRGAAEPPPLRRGEVTDIPVLPRLFLALCIQRLLQDLLGLCFVMSHQNQHVVAPLL